MSESPSDRGADTATRPPTGRPSRGDPLRTLDLVVVRRDDGPDHATIHSPESPGIARMET